MLTANVPFTEEVSEPFCRTGPDEFVLYGNDGLQASVTRFADHNVGDRTGARFFVHREYVPMLLALGSNASGFRETAMPRGAPNRVVKSI